MTSDELSHWYCLHQATAFERCLLQKGRQQRWSGQKRGSCGAVFAHSDPHLTYFDLNEVRTCNSSRQRSRFMELTGARLMVATAKPSDRLSMVMLGAIAPAHAARSVAMPAP